VALTLGWSTGARIVRWAIGAVITVLSGYLVAGRWDVPWLWAALGVASLGTLIVSLTIDPGLAAERRRPGPGARDRGTQLAMTILMSAASILAGLDVGRRHWSDGVPLGAHVAALALFALGYGLVVWAVTVNRFFSGVVRVQTDRGQRFVTTGPHRWVGHPGYLGMVVGYPMLVLATGSHLPGYRSYAAQVPNRLIPGVW
jgi:protein-S-isoprenylcysteine O-methyltransferase Ste14